VLALGVQLFLQRLQLFKAPVQVLQSGRLVVESVGEVRRHGAQRLAGTRLHAKVVLHAAKV
jgi:hypothetical protein